MRLLAGTSGFGYREWLGSFYPAGLPAREMLAWYAERFPAVEVNNTFYRMPRREVLAGWAAQVPPSFRFTVKASRRITHVKRLRDCAEEVRYLLEAAGALGEKLGALLFQLPPNLPADPARLAAFLELLPEGAPAAFEFRHASWLTAEVAGLLGRRGFALCALETDELEALVSPSAAWGYVKLRRFGYGEEELSEWLRRLRATGWREAYVFFKHEETAEGPRLAARFLELAGESPGG